MCACMRNMHASSLLVFMTEWHCWRRSELQCILAAVVEDAPCHTLVLQLRGCIYRMVQPIMPVSRTSNKAIVAPQLTCWVAQEAGLPEPALLRPLPVRTLPGGAVSASHSRLAQGTAPGCTFLRCQLLPSRGAPSSRHFAPRWTPGSSSPQPGSPASPSTCLKYSYPAGL